MSYCELGVAWVGGWRRREERLEEGGWVGLEWWVGGWLNGGRSGWVGGWEGLAQRSRRRAPPDFGGGFGGVGFDGGEVGGWVGG